MEEKYSRYISFPEVRKTVNSYMKGQTYSNGTQKANPIISNNNSKADKY